MIAEACGGAPVPFAAVLVAGGRSRRMGRDKALLRLRDGRLLWERQLKILQSLGPGELFVSGPARDGFPADVVLLADERPDYGPLSGIVAALEAMEAPAGGARDRLARDERGFPANACSRQRGGKGDGPTMGWPGWIL